MGQPVTVTTCQALLKFLTNALSPLSLIWIKNHEECRTTKTKGSASICYTDEFPFHCTKTNYEVQKYNMTKGKIQN